MQSFMDHFQRSLAVVGGREFIVVNHGRGSTDETRKTFAEIDKAARVVAATVRSRGAARAPVLLMYPQGIRFVEALLGCMYAGAVPVPVPVAGLDPRAYARAQGIIADTGARLILTDSTSEDSLVSWLSSNSTIRNVECLTTDDLGESAPDPVLPPVSEDTTAFLQYTSGSTRRPKGVAVTQKNLMENLQAIAELLGGGSDDVGVGWIPHFHDMGLVGLILYPLFQGFDCVLMSAVSFVRRPRRWLELVTRYRATLTVAPNFGYEQCVRRIGETDLEGLDLSSLRAALNGAEPVREETLRGMSEKFEKVGFRENVWVPCYGMAESTLIISGTRPGGRPLVRGFSREKLAEGIAVLTSEENARRLVGQGVLSHLRVRVVSPETEQSLPEGNVGEIWVQGGSVASGYWDNKEDTTSSFEAYTASGDGPYLRTGDLGFVYQSQLFVTGRLKDVLVINGRNVDANDVEECACEADPSLRGGAAFPGGEAETPVLVQEVSRSGGQPAVLDELAGRITSAVNTAHQIGRLGLVLVPPGTLLRTTSGKPKRAGTRDAWVAGRLKMLHENEDAVHVREVIQETFRASADGAVGPDGPSTLLSR